jgi:hypothetical protein
MIRRLPLLAATGLTLVPSTALAAPAQDHDIGTNIVLRTRDVWESSDSIDHVVKASGGRPTLIEFYDTTMIFT